MNNLNDIAERILAVLQAASEPISILEIRKRVQLEGPQEHFSRRLRELDPGYIIERIRSGKVMLYKYAGERPAGTWQYKIISKKLRAEILVRDGFRCQMCGKTVEADKVRLDIDHKIPQSWNGDTTAENLWATCSSCNEGKKNFFATFDSEVMKNVLGGKSVHKRIADLLHLKQGEWVDSDLIGFVANFGDWQTDWRKRLRELRYLGLSIEARRLTVQKRSVSQYRLTNWVELPDNPTKAAQQYEQERSRHPDDASDD